MTPSHFSKLLDYLQLNHQDLYVQYPTNFVLVDGGLGVFKPAKVSDETHKELMDIIDKWRTENNAD